MQNINLSLTRKQKAFPKLKVWAHTSEYQQQEVMEDRIN